MYIGWAVNVNKEIIDSTTISVGTGATVEDSLETGGQKKKRLICANPPDRYNVTMAFNCVEKGNDGLTELERFYSWYKWQHCYGVNPFVFPAILINSNRQQGMSQEDVDYIVFRIAHGDPNARLPDNEYYIITSAVEGSKSGNHLQLTMTWETYATGVLNIAADTSEVDRISAENGYVDVYLTSTPTFEPTVDTWTMKINDVVTTPTYCYFDGDVKVRLYFTPKTTAGTYTVEIESKTDTFIVA